MANSSLNFLPLSSSFNVVSTLFLVVMYMNSLSFSSAFFLFFLPFLRSVVPMFFFHLHSRETLRASLKNRILNTMWYLTESEGRTGKYSVRGRLTDWPLRIEKFENFFSTKIGRDRRARGTTTKKFYNEKISFILLNQNKTLVIHAKTRLLKLF